MSADNPVYFCPKCKEPRAAIRVEQAVTAYVDGAEGEVYDTSEGDLEWGPESEAYCTVCHFEGTVKDFNPD